MLRMDSVGKAAIAVLPVLFLMGCEAMRGEETAAVTPSTAEQTAQAAQQQASRMPPASNNWPLRSSRRRMPPRPPSGALTNLPNRRPARASRRTA